MRVIRASVVVLLILCGTPWISAIAASERAVSDEDGSAASSTGQQGPSATEPPPSTEPKPPDPKPPEPKPPEPKPPEPKPPEPKPPEPKPPEPKPPEPKPPEPEPPEPQPKPEEASAPPRSHSDVADNGPSARAFGRFRRLDNGRLEFLAIGTPRAVDRAEGVIEAAQGRILRREELPALGLSMIALDLMDRVPSDALRGQLRTEKIAVALDRNVIFSSSGGAGRVYAPGLVGATGATSCKLNKPVRIGLIDGPVDTARAGLSNVPVVARSVLDDTDAPADSDHATGLVSLIAAPQGATDVSGLAIGADIYSAVAFSRDDAGNGMRLDHFARGLNWLVTEKVDIVNMSISGPKNSVLAQLMSATEAGGTVLVAAAGNEGRSIVAYPAADPNVIAITAVDARMRLYNAANTGDQIAFAAPGVDLLVAGENGSGYRSGTSYATAIASAVIAHEIGNGARGRADVVTALKRDARDLGQPGHDPRFGWGLLQLSGC